MLQKLSYYFAIIQIILIKLNTKFRVDLYSLI